MINPDAATLVLLATLTLPACDTNMASEMASETASETDVADDSSGQNSASLPGPGNNTTGSSETDSEPQNATTLNPHNATTLNPHNADTTSDGELASSGANEDTETGFVMRGRCDDGTELESFYYRFEDSRITNEALLEGSIVLHTVICTESDERRCYPDVAHGHVQVLDGAVLVICAGITDISVIVEER